MPCITTALLCWSCDLISDMFTLGAAGVSRAASWSLPLASNCRGHNLLDAMVSKISSANRKSTDLIQDRTTASARHPAMLRMLWRFMFAGVPLQSLKTIIFHLICLPSRPSFYKDVAKSSTRFFRLMVMLICCVRAFCISLQWRYRRLTLSEWGQPTSQPGFRSLYTGLYQVTISI